MPKATETGGLRRLAILLRSSLWFVPGCLLLAAIALAVGMVAVDRALDAGLGARWPALFGGEVEGARAMLSAIATSMITVAGVVFSITIVALAQAATQYTSRVLRNFMRDRINQTVLGVFVGLFTYCLIVLQALGASDEAPFVPRLSVFTALVLAIVAIGFLILFIHHIAATLQAGEIVRTVMRETRDAIDRRFPPAPAPVATACGPSTGDGPGEGRAWHPVPAPDTGYVQSVHPAALLDFAIRHDTVVRMDAAVGGFVAAGDPLAHLALAQEPDAGAVRVFQRLYAIDSYRTADQDPEFGFRQLVDIALKALSPGINDTTTAVTCIDYLSVLLRQVAGRDVEPPLRCADGRLRVILRGPQFDGLLELSFGQILENAMGTTAVLMRLLRMVEEVAAVTTDPARRRTLAARVDIIEEVALAHARSAHARAVLAAEAGHARAACG